jgi:hypothetical protein
MKTLSVNTLITAILAACLGIVSLTVAAGQDESQRYQIQQFIKAKQKAAATEAAAKQAQAAEAAKQEATTDACRKMMEQSKDTNGS